jgi:putative ABC transport system permease protein
MLSAFDAWLIRPLPFPDAEGLVTVHEHHGSGETALHGTSAPTLLDWRERVTVLEGIEAFTGQIYNLTTQTHTERVHGAELTPQLLEMLGMNPILGRRFPAASGRPGGPRVALIGHHLWHDRYSGDPGVLGDSIRLDGVPHEIVGILPEGEGFPAWSQVWTPLVLDRGDSDREQRHLTAVARLRTDVGIEAAQAALANVSAELAAAHPETLEGWSARLRPIRRYWVPEVIQLALSASVVLSVVVLLVICSNVATLLLAQASDRQRETAIRSAVGAALPRLLRQWIIETVLLAVLAGGLGFVLAHWFVHLSTAGIPIDPPYLFELTTDPRMVVCTLLVALLAGLACALVPLVRSSRIDLSAALRSGGWTTAGRQLRRLREMLVSAEFASSALLVVGAVLTVQSFQERAHVDPGYRIDGVATLRLSLTGDRYQSSGERSAVLDRLLEELSALDGVTHAGAATHLPVSTSGFERARVTDTSRSVKPSRRPVTSVYGVTQGYLDALELHALDGRLFSRDELHSAEPVAIVSEQLAADLWPKTDPIAQQIHVDGVASDWLTVIGVVDDIDTGNPMVGEELRPESQVYAPYRLLPRPLVSVAVASGLPLQVVGEAARTAMGTIDPFVPVFDLATMRGAIREVRWVAGYFGRLFALYAALALLIAAIGAYGIAADTVARSARELGIRQALGASPAELQRKITLHTLRRSAAGVVVGLILAVPASRLLAGMLYGVSPNDPVVFAGVGALLLLTAAGAGFLPARRILRMSPAAVLRSQ